MNGRQQSVSLTTQQKQVRTNLVVSVEKYAQKLEQLVPRDRMGRPTMDAAFLIMSLELYLSENPKVLECSPASIIKGMLRVAQTGLIPGNSCDLLPFGKVCQFSPRYNGIAQLALASGVRAINIGVVRQGDHFEYDKGTNTFLSHQKAAKSTADIIAGYAIAQIKVGASVLEVMLREEIDAHRQKYSKSWWKSGDRIIPLEEIPWYGKKTPLRQMTPMLPQNPRLAAAMVYEREAELAEEGVDADELELIDERHVAALSAAPAPAPAAAAPAAAPLPPPEPARVGGPRETAEFIDDTDL